MSVDAMPAHDVVSVTIAANRLRAVVAAVDAGDLSVAASVLAAAAVLDGPALTVEQVATRYGVSVPSVRRDIREGRLPALRVGRRGVRVEQAALAGYVRQVR